MTSERTEPTFAQLGVLHPGSRLDLEEHVGNRFAFVVGAVRVNALLHVHSEHPDRLLVLTNGAVSRKPGVDPQEIFQRRTWVGGFRASTLFLSDPTIRNDNTLSIAWGQGTRDAYAIPAMAQTARFVAEALDIAANRRVYFGSSAGGFQALQLAARDEGSRALVNNPQIDWTRYMQSSVRSICAHSYDRADPAEVREAHPDRVHVAAAFARLGHVPQVRYLLNAASRNDLHQQAAALFEGLAQISGRSTETRIDIAPYFDKASGHMPLPKSRTLAEVNMMLDGTGS